MVSIYNGIFANDFNIDLKLFGDPFWGFILGQDRSKKNQDGPKKTINHFKISKISIYKNQ